MENNKFYITKAKYEAYLDEIKYLEAGDGSRLLAKLLASSPGSGMGRPNDLPAHILAGEMMGYLQEIKIIVRQAFIIDEIREKDKDPDRVLVGSTVCVQYEDEDETVEYTILGQKEVDTSQGKISCLSPIGSALIGKCKGELVVTKTPGSFREIRMKVLDVQRRSLEFDYGPSTWKEKLERALP